MNKKSIGTLFARFLAFQSLLVAPCSTQTGLPKPARNLTRNPIDRNLLCANASRNVILFSNTFVNCLLYIKCDEGWEIISSNLK